MSEAMCSIRKMGTRNTGISTRGNCAIGPVLISPAAPVFPGPRRALAMSNMVLLMLLRRMGRDDPTAHGFRSSLSD